MYCGEVSNLGFVSSKNTLHFLYTDLDVFSMEAAFYKQKNLVNHLK